MQIDLTNLPIGTDYDLYLYQAGSSSYLKSSTNGGTTPERIVVQLDPGRYDIRIYPLLGRSPQPYRLSVRWW